MSEVTKKISLQQIDISKRGDIYCNTCFYRALVIVEEPWASVWATYRHPKFDLIRTTPGFQQLAYITPVAIKFILNHLDAFICPRCEQVGMFVNPMSRYNPTKLLQSFKLCYSLQDYN